MVPLSEVGRGATSVGKALWHARKAVTELGADKADPMLLGLAQLGRGLKRHRERALRRWADDQNFRRLLPELYPFACTKWRSPRLGVQQATHWCLLPHEVLAALGETACTEFLDHVLGSPKSWSDFWRGLAGGAAGAGSSVLTTTPAPLGAAAESEGPGPFLIPFGIHGDDAGVHAGEKVTILTWGSLTSKGPALDSRIVFTMLKASEGSGAANVEAEVYRVLAWSFRALDIGARPDTDRHGVPWPPGSQRQAVAGQPLWIRRGRPVCMRFSELRGDWKFLKEALHLQEHYLAVRVRHRCSACKWGAPCLLRELLHARPPPPHPAHARRLGGCPRARGKPNPPPSTPPL